MQLNPYLSFNGTCEEAFQFYAKVLNGTIIMMMKCGDTPMADKAPAEQRNKIAHARMTVGGHVIMGGDGSCEQFEAAKGFCVHLGYDDPAEADRVFAALSEGGVIKMPIQETFWAKRFGMAVDRFGTPWMVNCEKM